MLRPVPASLQTDETILSSQAPVTDEALVPRILAGETALFELIMRRHNQRLYRAARAILNDDAEAEDVMQETYVRAFAHLAQFRGDALLSTWLTRIAAHEAFARVRQRRRLAALPPDDNDVETLPMADRPKPSDPEREANNAELRGLLERAIDELPETYRTVFVLREVEGLSTATTAECLGVSEEVVKTRLSRARARLRDGLYERAGAAAGSAFTFGAERCDRVVAAVLSRLRGTPA
jgi:RNA polymerase sigma-70 factor (ECF subfamily)